MEKSLTVWILQTGEPLHIDSGSPRPMRAMNLADALVEAGHSVTLFSSDFSHAEKKHRFGQHTKLQINEQLQYQLIPSPGYHGHMSVGRLYDHWVMGRNLKKILKNEKIPPDVAFVGFPPIEVAYYMACWLKKNKVPFLIDTKDQWPAIFLNAIPKTLRLIGRLILSPYFYMAKKAMQNASGISAMAQGFLNWSLNFSGREQNANDRIVPLTTPAYVVDEEARLSASTFWQQQQVSPHSTKIVFIGTHSAAFDMAPVIDAARYFESENKDIKFFICGNGPMTAEWKKQFGNCSNVSFPGWVDRAQIQILLGSTLAILAPYQSTENFVANFPNKVVDALSYGKPVLTGLKGEVETIVKAERVGLFYGESESKLEQCIEALIADPTLLMDIESNAVRVYREKYEYKKVYSGLVNHLSNLANRG